ncbi:DUF6221 family protein [Streptomyces sp. 900105755]
MGCTRPASRHRLVAGVIPANPPRSLRTLAQPYARHPGYRREWRPRWRGAADSGPGGRLSRSRRRRQRQLGRPCHWDARAAACVQERAGTGGTCPLLRSAPAYLPMRASASTLMIGSLSPAQHAPGVSPVPADGCDSNALVKSWT